MNSEQRLLSWIESELKPSVSITTRSILQVYLSSSSLISHLLRYLYDIEITGPAVLPTLLRTLMPGEKNLTMDDVFAHEELFQDVVSLLSQRILRKAQIGRNLDETTQEDIYHILAAFDSCQQRKERLLEALEVVEADIYAQQRELKNTVQSMSSEIADLLLKCEVSKKSQKQRPTVTFADSASKGRNVVSETDNYYEEIEELTIDELSSPSTSYSGAPQGPLTTSDDKRIAQLQDNIQRITSVLKAYKEQQEESGRQVRDSDAQIRILTETREENYRCQVLINDLNSELDLYKTKLADIVRERDLLQEKLASSKPTFGQSSHINLEKSSPSIIQSSRLGKPSFQTPDSTKLARTNSQSKVMESKARNSQSTSYQKRNTASSIMGASQYQTQPSTPTLSAGAKITELRAALKQKDSIILELKAEIADLSRASNLSANELKDLEEKYRNLLIKSDKLRAMLRAVEQRIKEYSTQDTNLTCNPTGRDAVELLSSFYHLLREKCYEFAQKASDFPTTKLQRDRISQEKHLSDQLGMGVSTGPHGRFGSGHGHAGSAIERENERLRAMVRELSSGKDSFERRLSQLEGQISQQNKRADETRRDPLLMSNSLSRSTRLDRSTRLSSQDKGYGDRFRRSSHSDYEYSGDYDDISLNNLTYRLRSDSKRIAMLTSDSKRPRSSRRY